MVQGVREVRLGGAHPGRRWRDHETEAPMRSEVRREGSEGVRELDSLKAAPGDQSPGINIYVLI